MKIKQWEDKNLAQFSYAVLSDCEKKIILIDPSRNPQPYLDYAKEHDATIVGIIETHPHADFVSSHAELRQLTGATIYTHSLVGASYEHQDFDEGATIELGKIKLTSIHAPGHSPDGISILLEHDGKQKAVFTGDTLFIGDCGRPDLREGAGNLQSKREDLAKQMYHSLREKLATLKDDVLVYPAHGAGTLCGKNLSKESSSTIGQEKQTNWSLQEATEEEFVQNLLADQPFIPAYFPFNVEVNRKGAAPLQESISKITVNENPSEELLNNLESSLWIVDIRKEADFKEGHLPHSINLMIDGKFETWLGSIINPEEKFYLAGESKEQLQKAIERAAAIGYEAAVEGAFVINGGPVKEAEIDVNMFRNNLDAYTVVDVRNTSEVKEKKIFSNSISIPLAEIRERVNEIPTDKPVVIHCAGGYRSAAASSLVHSKLDGKISVFDLSEEVKKF
ncbi:MBL fold metallo-hydrolase [Aridibaculum aurantiacum]|uniref:MBL fold metallo-hydrolase n=1 Tax=Aridibaculum aurantiacum TaxID=2810307 RepID=UPI001A96230C|nr:rhodanese-like domain-containing protein [Aridibaculum aurantiacum]